MSNVDNKYKKKSHGQMLAEIAHELRTYMTADENCIFVREGWLYIPYSREPSLALAETHGVASLYAWSNGQKQFHEIQPKTIKKILTGDQNAKKDVVAAALEPYVGKQDYACDDESDAVAVGVAWLIKNNK